MLGLQPAGAVRPKYCIRSTGIMIRDSLVSELANMEPYGAQFDWETEKTQSVFKSQTFYSDWIWSLMGSDVLRLHSWIM